MKNWIAQFCPGCFLTKFADYSHTDTTIFTLCLGYMELKTKMPSADGSIIAGTDLIWYSVVGQDQGGGYNMPHEYLPATIGYSFYQMLDNGFDVNVLIVGDSIGAGSGASDNDHRWINLLKANLESKYRVSVKLTNVSMGGNTSYAGYVRTMTLKDDAAYDLVILCYGQNDSTVDFSLYYESVLRAIKLRYPSASIICIQESSQKDYTEKMQIIQAIADHYGLPVADTIAPFRADYKNLVMDGTHPNDDGHQIYYETVMGVINSLVTAHRGYDPQNVPVVNDRAMTFDTFQWFRAEQFAREGNAFTLSTQMHGVILGIDYCFTSGTNQCKILVDGVEFAASKVTFNYDFSQRHIMIVNDWLRGETVNVQREIKVLFAENEAGKKQADGFIGLAISGE